MVPTNLVLHFVPNCVWLDIVFCSVASWAGAINSTNFEPKPSPYIPTGIIQCDSTCPLHWPCIGCGRCVAFQHLSQNCNYCLSHLVSCAPWLQLTICWALPVASANCTASRMGSMGRMGSELQLQWQVLLQCVSPCGRSTHTRSCEGCILQGEKDRPCCHILQGCNGCNGCNVYNPL